jgi:cell division protein FtsW
MTRGDRPQRKTGGATPSTTARLALRLDRPLTSYYLIFGATALLTALGLVMVLSSSMIDSFTATGSAFSLFTKQILAAAIGLPLMVLASHLPLKALRAVGLPAMVISVGLLALTTIQGESYYTGATRWLELGGMTIQPSEPAKLAFALWGASVLARRDELKQLDEWRQLLLPLLPGAASVVLLVLLTSDLGTTCVLLAIFLALLWVIGAPGKLFVGMFGLVAVLVAIMVTVAPYRMARMTVFLDPYADPTDSTFQAMHGLYALGTGGLFGVGIGASREKWGMLPHPESDFIFAIIGEELGLLGTVLVIGLYGVLGYAGFRVALRARESFVRLAAAAITTWVVVQAFVNIGTVIGVLPVTGIPLPLISAGGSALIPTLVGLGVLLALAKAEPEARKALAARGPGLVERGLRWLGWGPVRGPRTARTRQNGARDSDTRDGPDPARRSRRR